MAKTPNPPSNTVPEWYNDTLKHVCYYTKSVPSQQGGSTLLSLVDKVSNHILSIRDENVILDVDVASLYDVETKRVNEAVHNNPGKFPDDYMFQLTQEETQDLRSKNSSANLSPMSRTLPKAFTEKGLYMLATILKSKKATEVTFAIIETFTKVRNARRELVELHREVGKEDQVNKAAHFGEMLTDIVMPDLETSETESTLEINFVIGKIKHTVKRTKKGGGTAGEGSH